MSSGKGSGNERLCFCFPGEASPFSVDTPTFFLYNESGNETGLPEDGGEESCRSEEAMGFPEKNRSRNT